MTDQQALANDIQGLLRKRLPTRFNVSSSDISREFTIVDTDDDSRVARVRLSVTGNTVTVTGANGMTSDAALSSARETAGYIHGIIVANIQNG